MEARILRWRFGLDDEEELTLCSATLAAIAFVLADMPQRLAEPQTSDDGKETR